MKRRFVQFSLRSLFGLTVLVSVVFAWVLPYRDLRRARYRIEFTRAAFEAGMGTYEDYCTASRELREAACRVPFADRETAGLEHLERINEFEAYSEPGLCEGHPDFADQVLRLFQQYREEAEQWLKEDAR